MTAPLKRARGTGTKKTIALRFGIFLLLISTASTSAIPQDKIPFQDMVVHIGITAQRYDYFSPWNKGPVTQVQASGAVLPGNMIVTAAQHLADSQLVEIQKHGGMKKYRATIAVRDYRTGIALITVDDPGFFADLKPVELAEPGRVTGEEAIAGRWDDSGGFREYPAKGYGTALENISDDIFDSASLILVHSMTSAMENGGYGEPVFIRGKLAGIATGYTEKNSALKVCAAENIRQVLRSVPPGASGGVPFFLAGFIPLESDVNLRAFLKLKPEDQGIYVGDISPLSSGGNVIKKGDVITEIDGRAIDDRGLSKSAVYGTLDFRGLIFPAHSAGETLKMKVIRGGTPLGISFRLLPYPDRDFTVPHDRFDVQPAFYIFGGLIFQELTRGYLASPELGNGSRELTKLHYLARRSMSGRETGNRRVVILNRVLPDPFNSGYENKRNLVLASVNGIAPADLGDARRLISGAEERYIRFAFTGGESIVLDRFEAARRGPSILRRYTIDPP